MRFTYWLRWLLLVPGWVGLAFLIGAISRYLTSNLWMAFLAQIASTYLRVYYSTQIAPAFRYRVACGLAALEVLLFIALSGLLYTGGLSSVTSGTVVAGLAGCLLGAFGALKQIEEEAQAY